MVIGAVATRVVTTGAVPVLAVPTGAVPVDIGADADGYRAVDPMFPVEPVAADAVGPKIPVA